MYTRCPKCETCFRVTDRHLAIAKGKVRCGKCQLVFNALDNAIDDLPGNAAATPSPQSSTPSPVKTEVKPEEMSPAAKLKAIRIEAEKQHSATMATSVKPSAADIKPSTVKAEETTVAKTWTAKEVAAPAKQAEAKADMKSAVPPPKVAPPLYKTSSSTTAPGTTLPDELQQKEKQQPAKKLQDIEETKSAATAARQEHHDAFHVEDDSFDEDFDFDAAIDELTHAAEEVTYDYDQAAIEPPTEINTRASQAEEKKAQHEEDKPDDVFSIDDYDENNATSVADILDDVKGQLSLDIDSPAQAEKKPYNADDEFQFIELDEEPVAEDKSRPIADKDESNDEFIKNNFDLDEFEDDFDLDDEDEDSTTLKQAAEKQAQQQQASAEEFLDQFDALDANGSNDKEEIIIANPDSDNDSSIKIGEHSDDYEVPYQLRDDVDRLNAPAARRLHPAIKVSLIVVLLVLSFTQLAYFRAFELVNIIPASRATLESFCEKVGCQYSGPSDTRQIELVSRDVRQHPKEKNALLISAAMVNNAYFAQPYPNIHIRLSDISGNVVAERIFNPKTYMGKLSNPFLLMRSKTPVHINFEVVDPGKDAVNFEFTFL